jgi:hypothetical protein
MRAVASSDCGSCELQRPARLLPDPVACPVLLNTSLTTPTSQSCTCSADALRTFLASSCVFRVHRPAGTAGGWHGWRGWRIAPTVPLGEHRPGRAGRRRGSSYSDISRYPRYRPCQRPGRPRQATLHLQELALPGDNAEAVQPKMSAGAPFMPVGRPAAQIEHAQLEGTTRPTSPASSTPDLPAVPRPQLANRQTDEQYEGCLSFFDLRGLVPRSLTLEVEHQEIDGQRRITVFQRGIARLVAHVPWRAGAGGSPRATTVTWPSRVPEVGGGLLVPWARLERATYCLGGSCSIR